MTRIDELQKRYPTIPKEVILKWEVLRNGVKDTADLDKVSAYVRALNFSYQSYDQDLTLKEIAEKRPESQKPGYTQAPTPIFMKNGMMASTQRNTKSPYEVRDLGGGRMALFEGDEQVDVDIYFLPHRGLTKEELVTSSGTPVPSLIDLRRICFAIMPVRHCEYFNTGDQCKFCNFNGTQEDARAVGLNRSATINLEEAVEAYKIAGTNVRFVEGRLEMGGFVANSAESKIHLNFVERIAGALPYKPSLSVHCQPMSRKELQRLKDAGTNTMVMQPEVWDPQLFAEVCPGKDKRNGYERYKESCLEVVDVLGVGQLGINFVGGVTMVPENGFKTWQEARDSHIEGNDWSIRNGVMPSFTNLRLPPGSVYGADPAQREKVPPTEFYLDLALAHDKAMTEVSLYDNVNKLMYCGLHCQAGPYVGEVGIINRFGDFGKWMSAVVPDEDNWMAKFIQSVQAPARAE